MSIFDPQSATMIQNWDQTIKNQIKIKLITTNHIENNQFVNFSDLLVTAASNLIIKSEKGENDLPGFLLRENITYSALPLEKELEPFLEALSQINSKNRMLSDQIKQGLDKIDIPVQLKLYIALGCPHCPNVVRTLIQLALYCKNINLHIIDGSLFPETAQKDSVLSAPCLILDDEIGRGKTASEPSHYLV